MRWLTRCATALILSLIACIGPLPGFCQGVSDPCDRAPLERRLATADSLLTSRQFPEALAAYAELQTCVESRVAPDSLVARFHRDYGWALARCDSLQEAEGYLSRALADWETLAGDSSAGFGISLERYARWRASTGDFEGAHQDFLRAWLTLGESLGSDDHETLWAEQGLALTLDHFRQRDEALAHIAHVFAVRQRTLPPGDLDLAWACYDYAVILHALGRLSEAEDLYRQSYEARRHRLPALFCQAGWGYAMCLADEGDYRQALRVMTDVDETVRGDPEMERALAVGTTATAAIIAMHLGDLRGTARLENRFHELARRYGVDEHTWNRNRLVQAYVLEHEGKLQAALDTLRVRLVGLQKTYGANSPLTVPELARQARLEARLGHASRADSLYRSGLAVADPTQEPALYGSLAADYVRYLTKRSRLSAAEPWAEAALGSAAILPAAHIVRSKVDEAVGQLRLAQHDPGAAWEFAQNAASASLQRYQLNLQAMSSDQISVYWTQEAATLDLLLTLLCEEACGQSRFVEAAWTLTIASRGSLLDELTRRRERGEEPDSLRSLKRHFANLLTMDPVEGPEFVPLAQLRRLETRIADIEEHLAATRASAALCSSLGLQALTNGLPSPTTLVAYVQYRKGGIPHYGAFLLGPREGPRFQDLGDTETIDSLIAHQSDLMAHAHEELLLDPGGAELAYRVVGDSLRASLLDPVLGSRLPRDLVVILTGPIWGVNFPTLPRGTTSYLVDELTSFRLVESERELMSTPPHSNGRGFLAVGGIDYSGWGAKAPAALPNSRDEAERVVALWEQARPGEPTEILTGTAAQESSLPSRIAGRQAVHIATHTVTWADPLTGEPCAGLRLTKPPRGQQGADGTWSEREIALENFASVELAFLSSCRSFEGTSLPGERLAGLYRAFRLAGVPSAILSVSDVGDRPSRDWCLRFYDHFLGRDGTASEAAFHTSSEILAIRRSTGRPTHPYYWGCFLAVGD